MSKTQDRKRKWARIEQAQQRDSLSIQAGHLQKPAHQAKGFVKSGGKAIVRAAKNARFSNTGERIYSTAQQCWAHSPNWYKTKH